MKISLIQYSSGNDLREDFDKAMSLAKEAVLKNPDIICFPEDFLRPQNDNYFTMQSFEIKSFQAFAKENNVNLILGSVNVKDNSKKKATNTCFIIDRSGKIVHRYDKIFMYKINKNGVAYDETAEVKPGKRLGLFELDGIKMGVGICVDIRFSFYFASLVRCGAKIIFLPAVMRKITGAKLWKVLPIARAIECQTYFCANSQMGNKGGSKTGDAVGNSKIISYDGGIISEIGEEEGICTAEIDLKKQEIFRNEILMLDQFNRKFH